MSCEDFEFNLYRSQRSVICLMFVACFCLMLLVAEVRAESGSIESGHSAMWFDPARSGEGWVLEILRNDIALMYWYTYDEQGNQRWLQGVGHILRSGEGDVIEFEEIYITRGPGFGPDYDFADLEIEVVGHASMRFADCDYGTFTYSAFGQSQAIPIRRLTQTMGGGCAPPHGVPGQVVHEYAGQSGSWLDPGFEGQGFSLHWMSTNQALLTWYTYDNEGNQYWMLGQGYFDEGVIVFPELLSTRGAKFGEAFDADDVELLDWGSLQITLDCEAGTAIFQSSMEQFGSGVFELDRLTLLKSPTCPWVAPQLSELYEFSWNEVPVPMGVRLAARSIADDGTIAADRITAGSAGPLYHMALWMPDQEQWKIVEQGIVGASAIAPDASEVLGAGASGQGVLPMLWTEAAGWVALDGFDFHRSLIGGVSRDLSHVVGNGFQRASDQSMSTWIWDEVEGQRVLPASQHAPGGRPSAVSNDGATVVGDANEIQFGYDNGYGIVWQDGAEPELLLDDNGERLGRATACNHDCSVVVGNGWGGLYDPTAGDVSEAWYSMPSGEFAFLGRLSHVENIFLYTPRATSEDGSVVVGSYFFLEPGFGIRQRAFVWTQDTGIQSIFTLINELDIGDENWKSLAAIDVSSSGEKILLSGEHPESLPNDFKPRVVVLELRVREQELD